MLSKSFPLGCAMDISPKIRSQTAHGWLCTAGPNGHICTTLTLLKPQYSRIAYAHISMPTARRLAKIEQGTHLVSPKFLLDNQFKRTFTL